MEIKSIAELINAIDILVKETGGTKWWFRGHSSTTWDLLPSVKRNYTKEQEQYFTNEFYVRAKSRYKNCPSKDDHAAWLALMQHYGLPTRLLDWSGSPLVAAFFASELCQPNSENQIYEDACIWALAPGVLNSAQGFETLLYPLDANSLQSLIIPARKGADTTDQVAAAWAVEFDVRMQMQQGAFTIHASDTPLNKISGCEKWLRKYIIPTAFLKQMEWELTLLGIRRGNLFPDLENLSLELRRLHRPRIR